MWSRPELWSHELSPNRKPVQPADVQPRKLQPQRLSSFLVPAAEAVVRVEEGRAEVSTTAWTAAFDGVLAADVANVANGAVSPRLAALAKVNQAAAALASWQGHKWLPLTALDALRLDGFDTLFVEVVGICNERCQHCYAESGPTVESSLDRETCEAIIDDAAALGFRRIQFTGGDPLLCSFLPDLVARAHKFDVREIYTNGLALTDELIDKLAPHKPSFAFSYYSHDPQIHDAITRTPGSHRRTRAAITRAVSRGLPVRAAMVVFNDNVDGVDATVADLKSLGVGFVSTGASMTAGRGSAFAWQPRSGGNAGNAGHRAADARGEGKLCVTYEGNVVPCIFNRGRVLGNVNASHRLSDVIATLAATPGPAADADKLSCGSCRLTDYALAQLEAS
jgi:MoaA/NifB/PqqE/SkfB family radical SAM enzyme